MGYDNPRIRTVTKYKAPYMLNHFPEAFAYSLAEEIVYFLTVRDNSRLEGSDWEEMFATVIGAQWKPSNVGLDDIVLNKVAWGAKSVKLKHPSQVKAVRLISGRNSITYSFGETDLAKEKPNDIGNRVVSIWNKRVQEVKTNYSELRTVVLIKSDNLLELAVFEIETREYVHNDYIWKWNKQKNLEGYTIGSEEHVFTWQPHGSQFTIIEKVPSNRLAIRIRKPIQLDKKAVIAATGFNQDWVEIIK